MTILLLIAFFDHAERDAIALAIVDQDESTETMMLTEVLEESNHLGEHIELLIVSEEEALASMERNEVSTIITLPKYFTSNLYDGIPVELEVIGNEKKEWESYIVYELLESLMRHITTAQANILLINEYAKKTPMTDSERMQLIQDEFIHSFASVLGKDTLVSEHFVENIATTSPHNYFTLSAYVITMTIWIVVFYHFFYDRHDHKLQIRLRVYGVKQIDSLLTKGLFTILICLFLTVVALFFIYKIGTFTFYRHDVNRIFALSVLYIVCMTALFALIETVIKDGRFRLLTYSFVVLIFILLSGAIIPTLYFPEAFQSLSQFIPTYEWLYQMQQLLLYERVFIEWKLLCIYTITLILLFLFVAYIKERRLR